MGFESRKMVELLILTFRIHVLSIIIIWIIISQTFNPQLILVEVPSSCEDTVPLGLELNKSTDSFSPMWYRQKVRDLNYPGGRPIQFSC